MVWLWLTLGMLIRTAHLSVLNFKKYDLVMMAVALIVGLSVVGEISDGSLREFVDPWIGLPLGFTFVIAFVFKDRLLPKITEGTLFGYCLVAGYVFFTTTPLHQVGDSISSVLLLVLISLLFATTTVLILSPERIGELGQTIMMVLFICTNIYIGISLAIEVFAFRGSGWELTVVGYGFLALVSNVFYILYFIPITRKHQSFKERLRDIIKHARDLEEKYIAINSTPKQILFTLLLFCVLIGVGHLHIISDAFLISTVLTFITLVHTPPEKSRFIPASVVGSL